ncbi:hypothetical protein [Haloarchaeobius amylolyticus]|uniref:hypothetical protein n=1 Tax=Haloarchaeobius amylolyticus TaxID=1198296 RepID=UPI00226EBD11|nr:hypothetical protein [Haloarchaeobius amylolyticus]
MPTRESESSRGSSGDLADVVDAFDADPDAVIEHNDTGESTVADPAAVFDSLLERDDSDESLAGLADDEARHPVPELDGAFAAVESDVDREADGRGRWLAYDEFDFGAAERPADTGSTDTGPTDTGPSAHEEFKSLAAESGAVDLDDLDLEELALGDGTVAASLDLDAPSEEEALADVLQAGETADAVPGSDADDTPDDTPDPDDATDPIDEAGFDWD